MKHFFYICCILLCTLCSCCKSNTIIVKYTNQISKNDLIEIKNECPFKCKLTGKTIKIKLPKNIHVFNNDLLSIFITDESQKSYIKNIKLPKNITKIEDSSFSDLESLQSITLPKNITEIEEYTFDHCKSLKSINLPENITKIGVGAFYYCESLTSINLPESITEISDEAFLRCQSLDSIYLPQNIKIMLPKR